MAYEPTSTNPTAARRGDSSARGDSAGERPSGGRGTGDSPRDDYAGRTPYAGRADYSDLDDETPEMLARRARALEAAQREDGAELPRAGVFAAGLAIGALLGAGIALLTAPQSGATTRRLLRRQVSDLRDDAGDVWGELGAEVRHVVNRGRRRLKRKANRARWATADFVER